MRNENRAMAMQRLIAALFCAVIMAVPQLHADDALLMKEWIAKAAQGDSRAQVSLAVRYRDGKGVQRDYAEANRK